MDEKVGKKRRTAKLSSKNQVTLPVAALRAAHVEPGDEFRVEVDGEGHLSLIRQTNPLDEVIGAFPGLSAAADLEGQRDAWQQQRSGTSRQSRCVCSSEFVDAYDAHPRVDEDAADGFDDVSDVGAGGDGQAGPAPYWQPDPAHA